MIKINKAIKTNIHIQNMKKIREAQGAFFLYSAQSIHIIARQSFLLF